MMKKVIAFLVALFVMVSLAACGGNSAQTVSSGEEPEESEESDDIYDEPEELSATVILFADEEYETVMEELTNVFHEYYPEVEVAGTYGSSEELASRIEEGETCDLFFSSDADQMAGLEEGGFLVEDARYDVTGTTTGEEICQVAQVVNDGADDDEEQGTSAFIFFLMSDDAISVFQENGFDTDAVI